MTPEQKEARDERVAIMMICGKQTEETAQAYCDRNHQMYGIREQQPTQTSMFPEPNRSREAL